MPKFVAVDDTAMQWVRASAAMPWPSSSGIFRFQHYHDSKVHGVNMGPIWGRQATDGPHVGPMNFVIWVDGDYTE